MKNKISFFSLLSVLILFISFRLVHTGTNSQNNYNVTTWDAFGYYMYLPGAFIYHDTKELKWIPAIDSAYQVTGGNLYQAIRLKNTTEIAYTN